MNSPRIAILLFAAFLLWGVISSAVESRPADKIDVVSGAAANPKIWCPGGIGGRRLAVGQPNKWNRNDKVLFRFSLRDVKNPVARAELRFRQAADRRNAETEELIVEHFDEELKELTPAALKEKKVTPVGSKYLIEPGKPAETILDVTELVREDLRRGYGSIAFRVSSLVAARGAPKNKLINSVDIDKNSIVLEIWDEKELKNVGAILSPSGKPYQGIEVEPDTSLQARYAARELQDHLFKITGRRLPVFAPGKSPELPVIAVGRHAAKKRAGVDLGKLRPEGFLIRTTPDALVIAGNDHEGPPLILDKLLKDYRFVWCFTTRCAAVPSLGLYLFGDAGSVCGVYRFLERYAGVRWYMPGPDGCVIPENKKLQIPEIAFSDAPRVNYRNVLESVLDSEVRQWLKRMRVGGAAPVPINHSFPLMLKYKDTHPEYFALDRTGKRDFAQGCTIQGKGHLCLTNPGTVKAFAAEAIAFFRNNPDVKLFPVMPGDGLVTVCNCPACQAEVTPEVRDGRFSRHVWGFVNKVAREVAKEFPDRLVGCCAYEQYRTPPEDLKFEPNVAVQICYNRYQMHNPLYAKQIHRIIDAWASKVKNIYTWNYYLEWKKGYEGLLAGSPRQYRQDFRRLAASGVWKGEFLEAGSSLRLPLDIRHLLIYVTCRLMWDPDTDVDALLDEYYRLFYGPAEREMKIFFETAFTAFEQKKDDGPKDHPPAPESIYTPAVISKLETALEEARKKAPEKSVYRRRIDGIRKQFLPAAEKLKGYIVKGKPALTAEKFASDEMIGKVVPAPFCGRDGETPEHRTWVAAGYDAERLYLRFYCHEEKMAELKADYTGPRDGNLWSDDTMEVFICPDPADPASTTCQFAVNPNGRLWDGKLKVGEPIAGTWNSKDVKTHVTRQSDRWILDMSIPLAELGVTPGPGKEMKVNFIRNRITGGKGMRSSCFAPLLAPTNFTPHRFATLTLGK